MSIIADFPIPAAGMMVTADIELIQTELDNACAVYSDIQTFISSDAGLLLGKRAT